MPFIILRLLKKITRCGILPPSNMPYRRSLHPCTQFSNISYSNNRKSFIARLFGRTSRRLPGRRTRGEPIIKKICVPTAFQRRVDEERCQTLRTCMHNASNQTPCHVRCHSGLGILGTLGVHTSPPHMNEVCGRRGLVECYILLGLIYDAVESPMIRSQIMHNAILKVNI